MMKPIFHSLAKQHLLWKQKFDKGTEIVDIVSQLSSIQTLLILMPEKLEDFGVALNKLQELKKHFPKSKRYGVIRAHFASIVAPNFFEKLIVVSPQEISLFGIPRKQLLKTIMNTSYDLVIDFNQDFDMLATYLCTKLDSKVRVCLAHPWREPFYNLQIRTKKEDTLENKINTMFKYLSTLARTSPARGTTLIPA